MVSPGDYRNSVRLALLLAVTALVGTGLVGITNRHSAPYIADNERQQLLRGLNAVIPADSHDNDLLDSMQPLDAVDLNGLLQSSTIWRATHSGEPVAVALNLVAPRGYNGPIELLVGIDEVGSVTGVRVVKHRETPGLGDGIEIARNDWIEGFTGRSLDDPGSEGWRVARDGGAFDQLTGATVTSRAVVQAVHAALRFVAGGRAALMDPEVIDE